jgi:hypothetical protein
MAVLNIFTKEKAHKERHWYNNVVSEHMYEISNTETT